MKKFAATVFLTISASGAFADAGPYYVSYPGYCNIKRVYINANGDLYGAEVGCAAIMGQPVIGSISTTGVVGVARYNGTASCLETYQPTGQLRGGCSDGNGIVYAPNSTYTVRSSGPREPDFVVSSEAPDLEKTKNLPQRP